MAHDVKKISGKEISPIKT